MTNHRVVSCVTLGGGRRVSQGNPIQREGESEQGGLDGHGGATWEQNVEVNLTPSVYYITVGSA